MQIETYEQSEEDREAALDKRRVSLNEIAAHETRGEFTARSRAIADAAGLEFTAHAIDRMWQRGIDPDWVPAAVTRYDVRSSKQKAGRTYWQLWGRFPNGERYYLCLDITERVVVSVGWRDRADNQEETP